MKKFFAIADIDNSFIVSADTQAELNRKLDEIRQRYASFYRKFVAPGFHVVQASTIREAKQTRQHV